MASIISVEQILSSVGSRLTIIRVLLELVLLVLIEAQAWSTLFQNDKRTNKKPKNGKSSTTKSNSRLLVCTTRISQNTQNIPPM